LIVATFTAIYDACTLYPANNARVTPSKFVVFITHPFIG